MKTMIAGLVISLALALLPPPKITVQNPKLLYAVAMYKTAVGDTDSALRLVERAERVQQSAGVGHPVASKIACYRSAILTIL